jgi:transposase
MHVVADQSAAPAAIRTHLGAIFVSLELSKSTWLVTSLLPGGGEHFAPVTAGEDR